MAGKKYWKISLVDMVITCENIGFITRGLWPLVINPIFSLVITITTRDIFQYFFPAIYYYLNCTRFVFHLFKNLTVRTTCYYDYDDLRERERKNSELADVITTINGF